MIKKKPGIDWAWRAVYPILAYYGIYYLIFLLAGILGMTVTFVAFEKSGGGSIDYYTVLENTALWLSAYSYEISAVVCLFALPVALLFLRADRLRAGETGRRYDRVSPAYYAVVVVLGACSCLAVNGLMYISGIMTAYSDTLTEVSARLYQGQLAVELLGIGVLSPVVEECIFRGLCLNRLKDAFDSNISILISAVLFAFFHDNILQMAYAFMLGLIFGYVYERFHSLAAPILAHCGANIISVLGSETDLLDRFFESDSVIMVSTVVWCLLILGCVYLVHYHVSPALLHKGTESSSQDR